MAPLLSIPPFGLVRSHSLMLVLAVVASVWLSYRWCVAAGLEPRRVRTALFLVAFLTLLGGRLHFVLANWAAFGAAPLRVFSLSSSGLHAPGAIVAAVFGGALAVRAAGLPALRFLDCLALAAGVGVALARFGCFLQGCCFGKICALPWGIRSPRDYLLALQSEQGLLPIGATEPLPVHPLQLYFAAAALATTALVLWLARRRRYDGRLGAAFLVAFFVSSAGLETLRYDSPERVYWGRLPALLWLTAGMAVVSSAILAWAEARHRTTRPGRNA